MSAWGGQTVTLAFHVNQVVGGLPTAALLDDVALGSTFPDVWSSLPALSGHPGDVLTTTLTCGNRGGAAADHVQLALNLPAGLTLESAEPAPAGLSPAPTWNLGSVAAKTQACSIRLALKIARTFKVPNQLTAQVHMTTNSTELETENNLLSVNLQMPYYFIYMPRVPKFD